MAFIILAFSLSLSFLDRAGEASLNSSSDVGIYLNGAWGLLALASILSVAIFKLFLSAASYFKRYQK
jgi:hypothetical protein